LTGYCSRVQAQGSYDVLVLGGGTAGSVLAARLSEDQDRSVCLVEAGPDYGSHGDGAWPSELLDGRERPDTHDWRDETGPLMVARVISGCSAHNLCLWIHPAAADWEEWVRASGDNGWSPAAMRAQIDRVESVMPLRKFTVAELNPWLRTCMDAAAEIGLGVLDDVNDHRYDTGLGPTPLNAVGTTRWNAAFAYLDAARSRPNLTILADSLVERVELSGDRAVGALVSNSSSRVVLKGGRVILTAGSYGSPAVLMRSGIGPQSELARHGIPLAADLPVGQRLRDHLMVRMRFAPTAAMQDRIDEHATSGLTFFSQGMARARSSQVGDGPWDLHLMVGLVAAEKGGFPERAGHLLGLYAALVKPEWTGAVTLRSRDPAQLPLVTPQDLGCERDMVAILDGIELCGELIRSEAARGAWQEQLVPDPALAGDALRDHCAGAVAPYFHPVGSCAIGRPGDGQSVVDATGRVHGFQNLYVADASIMPTIPRANTNLPVLAAAERIAELLTEQD
jgi:choline dehydrogenase